MPDTKISDLAQLALGGISLDDLFVLVDVSDTSMASSGTTKKIPFKNLGVPILLGGSGAKVADPGNTTAETTYATITVPANAMGANGSLLIWELWSYTNSANSKTMRVRFSGGSGTIFASAAASASVLMNVLAKIQNRGATNSQVGTPATIGTAAGTAAVTSSVDTTASATVVLTGQKATGTETLELESYLVVLIPGA